MNIVTSTNSIILVFVVIIAFVFTGCLGDTGNDSQQNVIEVRMDITGFEESIEAGDDSVSIDEVSFVHGLSFLEAEEDTLYFSSQPNVYDFGEETGTEDVLALGQIVPNVYSSMEVLISQAPEELRSIAPDFVTDDGRFSMIIRGSYNDEDFEFRSRENFEFVYPLSPELNVEEGGEEFYDYSVYSNMRDWFISEEGQSLIDPQESDSTRQLINDNIGESFFLDQ